MLFTTRRRQDGTATTTPLLRAPARGVDDGSGQQQNRVTSDNRGNGAGTRDGEAKTTTATSSPPPRAAVRGVETAGTAKTGRTQRRKRGGATTTETETENTTTTTRPKRRRRRTMRATTSTGQEQKAQAMDMAPYDEERKRRHLLGRR